VGKRGRKPEEWVYYGIPVSNKIHNAVCLKEGR